ncbi:SAM-dependent methyltransferase [Gracilibacillus xinjiangensis]|uniref:SAM-dependent methyltransferase n=1 Tax=Gracilibacillus xinjiangensis TaxID=1193282 RepID=A0ABV8WXW6_9BACI
MRNQLDLERIVFIGRTFEEYIDMFGLKQADLYGKKVLDCPAGACSFTAVGNQLGYHITACDIAYYYPVDLLKKKGLEDIKHAMHYMKKAKNNYIWKYFDNIRGLESQRLQALLSCTADMEKALKRYIPVDLPILPFDDQQFDLLLSAHFLFIYSDRLDYNFHLATINELLRVTKEEVRIFPLVDLKGERYLHLDKMINYLQGKGYTVEEKTVAYHFQKNANTMLRIDKKK